MFTTCTYYCWLVQGNTIIIIISIMGNYTRDYVLVSFTDHVFGDLPIPSLSLRNAVHTISMQAQLVNGCMIHCGRHCMMVYIRIGRKSPDSYFSPTLKIQSGNETASIGMQGLITYILTYIHSSCYHFRVCLDWMV